MRLKLTKLLSYSGGGIRVTREKPEITVDDELGQALLKTGYFEALDMPAPEAENPDDEAAASDTGAVTATVNKKPPNPKPSSKKGKSK